MNDLRLVNSISELVNYKFEYVATVPPQLLFLECVPLYKFIVSTSPVADVIHRAINELVTAHREFSEVETSLAAELPNLKRQLVEMYPDVDDSSYELTNVRDPSYLFTFRRFDKLLAGETEGLDAGTPVLPAEPYENTSPVNTALQILRGKITDKVRELKNNIPQPFSDYILKFRTSSDRYEFAFREFVNFKLVSLAESFLSLQRLVREINRQPRELKTLEDLWGGSYSYALEPLMYEPIRETVYKEKEASEELITSIKKIINRLRYGILAGLAENLSHQQVVNKFKTRCMWYDKARVRQLILDENGQYVRGKEDTLIIEMARYLFDNGYPVLFHVQTENLQTDLMDTSQRYPLLIEGKAYAGTHKRELIRGIAQLHGYLNNFDSTHYYVRDAYFVVFRLSGPIYDFPEQIVTNRYRIMPIVIDLGDSSVSGSRQDSQPVVITLEEILHDIEQEKSTD